MVKVFNLNDTPETIDGDPLARNGFVNGTIIEVLDADEGLYLMEFTDGTQIQVYEFELK